MPNIAKTLDFTNQTINVGMDVHLKQWNVTVFHEQQYLRKFQQEPVPETLIKHLTTNYPNAKFKLAYETGFCGFWIQRAFSNAGMECLVVHAADVPQTDKGLKTKSDTVDSRRIGQALGGGLLKSVHIPSQELESDRAIVRYRHRLMSDLSRSKNRIKSFYINSAYIFLLSFAIPDGHVRW